MSFLSFGRFYYLFTLFSLIRGTILINNGLKCRVIAVLVSKSATVIPQTYSIIPLPPCSASVITYWKSLLPSCVFVKELYEAM